MGEMPFTLEVTTPGVDRPLTLPRHWKKNVGRLVKITPKEGEKYLGRITEVLENEVKLDLGKGLINVNFGDVSRAQIEVEFNRKEVK
jgi:ribosome maturation factor RimP